MLVKILMLVRPLSQTGPEDWFISGFGVSSPPSSDTTCHGTDSHWSLALKAPSVAPLVS